MSVSLLKKGYNIYIIPLLLLSSLFGNTLYATPSCPIITNQFQDPNGTTIDAGATGWSLDSSLLVKPHPAGFFFAVTSNRFTATNLGAVGILNSHVFSIAGYLAPQVSVKITAEGNQDTTQYIQFYYKLNGGAEVLVATQKGNFGTLVFTSPTLSGSTVQLIVKIYDFSKTSTTSNYYIEQFNVFQTAGPCTPGNATIALTPAATNAGVLNCTNSSTTLSATSATTGLAYFWTGPNSFHSNSASPAVSAAGTYNLIVTTGVPPGTTLWGTANVTVTSNTTPPASVTATSPTVITCANLSSALTATSGTSGVTFKWSGPGSFSASGATATATVPGSYTVTATNPTNGCTATAGTTVVQTITTPTNVTIATANNSTTLTCTTNFLTLIGSSSTSGATYNWTGPNNFSSANAIATTSTAGTYTLSVTNPVNGCSSTAALTLSQDTASPGAITTSSVPANAVLTCTSPDIVFTGASGTPGVTYSWAGPNSFTAFGTAATVSTPGSYVLTATNPANGCSSAVTAAAVTQDIAVPSNISAIVSSVLNCNQTSVTLTANSTTAGVNYSWTGPAGFTSASRVATTTLGGNYTLTATNSTNGCSVTKPVTVQADTAAPANVTATNNGPLTCSVTSVTLTGNSSTPGVQYQWTGDDDGFFDPEQVTTVSVPEDYELLVINPENGCAAVAVTTVNQDLTACSMVKPLLTNGKAGTLDQTGMADSTSAGQFEYSTYPNPVSTAASIVFQSRVSTRVVVEIYNNLGVREKVLFSDAVEANQQYNLTFDASHLTAGMHYCVIRTNNKVYTSKVLITNK